MCLPIVPVLYIDPQQLPSQPCPRCGRECFGPNYVCLRCERSRP